jgi:hypothetical protein
MQNTSQVAGDGQGKKALKSRYLALTIGAKGCGY